MNKITSFLILALIEGIIGISGCISPYDLIVSYDAMNDYEPSINYTDVNTQKGIIPFGGYSEDWNFLKGEWYVNGLVHGTDGPYSEVKLLLTAYDSQNQVIGQKNITLYDVQDGYSGEYETIIKVKSMPDHLGITVLKATKYTEKP